MKFKINPFFFAYLAFLVYVDSTAYMLIIILSALIHECAHLLVMRLKRIAVKEICFSPLGIRITPLYPLSYGDEIWVAAAGPFINILIFSVIYLLSFKVNLPYTVSQTAVCCFILGFGNLIPVLPLDGGRILRGILYRYSEKYARQILSYANIICSTSLMAAGMYVLSKTGYNISVLLTGIYLSASFAAVFKGSKKCLKKD